MSGGGLYAFDSEHRWRQSTWFDGSSVQPGRGAFSLQLEEVASDVSLLRGSLHGQRSGSRLVHMLGTTGLGLIAAAIVMSATTQSFAGLTISTDPDAATWIGTPALSTMVNPQSATVGATLSATSAVSHSFNPATSFQLDKFTIRAAGAPHDRTARRIYCTPSNVDAESEAACAIAAFLSHHILPASQ